MPSPPLNGRALDLISGAAVVLVGAITTALSDLPLSFLVAAGILLVGIAAGLARRYPKSAALATAALLVAALPLRHQPQTTSAVAALMLATFFLAYWLGHSGRPDLTALPLVALGVAWQLLDTDVDPFIVIDTIGPWLVGLAIGSRTRAQAELEARNHALAAEQARYTAESLRFQRLRIARELHDVVAHAVTVMVVQAAAGEYLVSHDRAAAGEALDASSASAQQAQTDIGRLVGLLDQERTFPGQLSLTQLVAGARTAGLAITFQEHPPARQLPPDLGDVAYRVVQEAVTNAMKHAPGVPVDISTSCDERCFRVTVDNPVPAGSRSDLAVTGGGRGLVGMRERIGEHGGRLTAGPRGDGHWRVCAELPLPSRGSSVRRRRRRRRSAP